MIVSTISWRKIGDDEFMRKEIIELIDQINDERVLRMLRTFMIGLISAKKENK